MRCALTVFVLIALVAPARGEPSPTAAYAEEDDPKVARPSGAGVALKMQTGAARRLRGLFGVALELGSPDILGVSAVGRPVRWLRLGLGLGTNTVAIGVHGGATVVPLDYKISPSFTLEGGRMFEGGSNFVTEQMSVKSYRVHRIAYDYLNLHLGFEVGSPRRWLIFVHAGLSYLSMHVHGEHVPSATSTAPPTSIPEATLKAWSASGKLGVVVYL